MKVAKANAPAASPPKERNPIHFLLESLEEIHEKLDAFTWGAEVPAQVARELAKINDTLDWRCLYVLEQRLTRMESTMERIERKLS